MRFYCEHPDIQQEMESGECGICTFYCDCEYLPVSSSPEPTKDEASPSISHEYDEVKRLLINNSRAKKNLEETHNVKLWQDYWELEWGKYLTLVKAYQGHTDKRTPRPKEVRKELSALKDTAEKLKASLESISSYALREIISPEKISDDAFEVYSRLEVDLARFTEMLADTIKTIPPDRGGRPEEIMLKEFIKRLARLWKNITGEKAKTYYNPDSDSPNPFLDFVQLSCDLAGLSYQSKGALAQSIKRALQN